MKLNKFFLLIILSVFSVALIKAQNLEIQSLNVAGEEFTQNKYQLSWSLGQVEHLTYENSNIILTQGFQQPIWYPVSTELSIEKHKLDYNVFPNPAHDELNLNFQYSENGQCSYTIYNIQGKQVYHSLNFDVNANEKWMNTVSLAGMTKGVYLLKFHFQPKKGNYIEKVNKVLVQ